MHTHRGMRETKEEVGTIKTGSDRRELGRVYSLSWSKGAVQLIRQRVDMAQMRGLLVGSNSRHARHDVRKGSRWVAMVCSVEMMGMQRDHMAKAGLLRNCLT